MFSFRVGHTSRHGGQRTHRIPRESRCSLPPRSRGRVLRPRREQNFEGCRVPLPEQQGLTAVHVDRRTVFQPSRLPGGSQTANRIR